MNESHVAAGGTIATSVMTETGGMTGGIAIGGTTGETETGGRFATVQLYLLRILDRLRVGKGCVASLTNHHDSTHNNNSLPWFHPEDGSSFIAKLGCYSQVGA